MRRTYSRVYVLYGCFVGLGFARDCLRRALSKSSPENIRHWTGRVRIWRETLKRNLALLTT